MLAVSPMRCAEGEEHANARGEAAAAAAAAGFEGGFELSVDDAGGLLDDIDFGDFFLRLEDGNALPDLEFDPAEIFAEFEAGGAATAISVDVDQAATAAMDGCDAGVGHDAGERKEEKANGVNHDVEAQRFVAETKGDGDNIVDVETKSSPSSQEAESMHKPSSTSKSSQGKKKAKVDWTPELHRRFVQAVEQLGVDKAVPSRILELMGIDSLTRHNIASHLQKYRSHRKHMLAREAEAASWSQRRQMYAASGGNIKRDANAWTMPTIGFPPSLVQPFRPLHVWGHPTVDTPRMPMWPRHLAPRSPTPPWAHQPAMPPPSDPSFWHHHYIRGPMHMPTPGTPCMAMPMPTTRYPAPPAHGIVPYPMYRTMGPPTMTSKNTDAQLEMQAHPSTESIDAAIEEVLAKPWLPLSLGLKPPSLDSVMGELQRQGVSKVPPTCR